jgi:hypothetical protein
MHCSVKVVFWTPFDPSKKSICLWALPFTDAAPARLGASPTFGPMREPVRAVFHDVRALEFAVLALFDLDGQFCVLVLRAPADR